MRGMNKRDALALILVLTSASSPLAANPADMGTAFYAWKQQMAEYHAAVKHAQTPEQQAAVQMPDASKVAAELWKSISGKTGQREVSVRLTPEQRMRGAKPATEKRDTYEFEEAWAAPAVVWFVNHPQELARLFENKPRQLSFYADALLDSLERHHYASPVIAECIAKLVETPDSRTYNILEKVYNRNPERLARGYAALGMSILLANPSIAAEAGSQAVARGKRVYYLKQALALTPEDATFGHSSISDIVLEESYRLKHLSVGSVPPQISVRDTAGAQHSLPVAGKPTLIVFWNPAERVSAEIARKLPSLKQKYPELELAAITASADAEELEKSLADNGVEATYIDDASNSAGKTYRVTHVPTAVLLNERCSILYLGYPDLHLQAAIDSCFQNRGMAAKGPSVRVVEEAPAIQPGSQPSPAQTGDEAPALRDMPEF